MPSYTPTAPKPAVYRFWNECGDLLYVGCTRHGLGRLTKHHAWTDEVVKVTIERFETLAEARWAEHCAIRDEGPRCNVKRPSKTCPRCGGEMHVYGKAHKKERCRPCAAAYARSRWGV